MYNLCRVKKLNLFKLDKAASILSSCGKDMAQKYDLHHWDNPYFKTLIIAGLCSLKNDIYLVYSGEKPVATFMTKKNASDFHFEKLGTLPAEAGRGIGSWCLTKIEDQAREKGCSKVTMEVYEPSEHAIGFYQHHGYQIVGKQNSRKYTLVKMEKEV